MASGASDLEDRGHGDGLLEEVESVLATIIPIEGLVLACEFGERDLANVLKVGLEGGAKDEDVIKVHDDTDFEEVTKDVVHGGLECDGGIGESERHYEDLVVLELRAECGLVGVLADTDLVEATVEVDLGEIFGSTEAIKKFIYLGEWVVRDARMSVWKEDIMRMRVAISVATGSDLCSPVSLRARLSIDWVLMASISMLEDWAMLGEDGVDAVAEATAADEVEADAAAAATVAAAARWEVLVWCGGMWRFGSGRGRGGGGGGGRYLQH
ncbi:hypothetical protein CBR_g12149 [Chara braunii]|uniref:Uncharacterized protein n=1 Tax=Chara braunii TaxID=69332 RepID=A0A388KRE8_CHABU|nr:hypothetical protein CBR_g12149 [Chara braunii]|eukprot:GBG72578.1 hypothetical protein CBR_g12149 [Chara braunii]